MIHLSAVALSITLALAPQGPQVPEAGRMPDAAAAPADTTSPAGPRRLQRFGELDGVGRPGAGEAAEVPAWPGMPADTPVARRTAAVEHSQGYYTRLEVHRIGAYASVPLFAAEYFLGQNLLTSLHPASWVRPTHKAVAYGVAGVFGVNTITGVWNLWDARHDSNGQARRVVHALSMVVADAGFVWVGKTARDARFTSDAANRHRNIALGSIGLTIASGLFMQLTK